MASKRHDGVRVKWVETISPETAKDIPIFNHIGEALLHANSFSLVLTNPDKVKESRKFRSISFGERCFFDAFDEKYTLVGVRLHYSNGTSEYGFKFWEYKDIVYRENGVLESLFTKDGMVNPETGEVEDCYGFDESVHVPFLVVQKLHGYNEKTRDRARSRQSHAWDRDLDSVMHEVVSRSGYVTTHAEYSIPPGVKNGRKCAWDYQLYTPTEGRTRKWSGPRELLDDGTRNMLLIGSYTYLKSIYRDNSKERKTYGLIPVSEILSITAGASYSSPILSYHGEREVWNNLDAAVAGAI